MLVLQGIQPKPHKTGISYHVMPSVSSQTQVWSSISPGIPLGMVWRRHIPSLLTQLLQSSKKGPAGSPCPCFPAQNQLELSCSVQATQGILHQTSASNAGPKMSTSGLFPIVPVLGVSPEHLEKESQTDGKKKKGQMPLNRDGFIWDTRNKGSKTSLQSQCQWWDCRAGFAGAQTQECAVL